MTETSTGCPSGGGEDANARLRLRRARDRKLVLRGGLRSQLPWMVLRNPAALAKWVEVSLLKRFASPRCYNYPLILQIEITNRCNLRCRMCPREGEFEKMGVAPETMSFETFERIVEGWIGHIYQIHLFGRGEPLISPHLPRMIRYAADRGVPFITFNTNGHLLQGKVAEALASSELDELRVSIDGSDEATYQSIRGVPLERLKENLKAFRAMCDIPVSISATLSRENWDSVLQMGTLAQEVGAAGLRLYPVATYDYPGIGETGLTAEQKQQYKGFCDDLRRRCRQNGIKFMAIPHYAPGCNVPFIMAFVDVAGNLTVCCRLETMTVGNVLENDFLEVWRGPQMLEWRRRMLSKELPKACVDLECVHDWR